MPSASDISDAFSVPEKHLRWAKNSIEKINLEFERFVQSDFAIHFIESHPNGLKKSLKVRIHGDVPDLIEESGSAALLNIKHAYDQAIVAAITTIEGVPKDKIHFPWRDSPSGLTKHLKASSIPEGLWRPICDSQPYPAGEGYTGGNDTIRSLAKIANDKHTVGFIFQARAILAGSWAIGMHRVPFFKWQNAWDASKNEITVADYIGDIHVKNEYDIALEIFFNNPRLSQPINVLDGLDAFLNHAETTTKALKARCRELLL